MFSKGICFYISSGTPPVGSKLFPHSCYYFQDVIDVLLCLLFHILLCFFTHDFPMLRHRSSKTAMFLLHRPSYMHLSFFSLDLTLQLHVQCLGKLLVILSITFPAISLLGFCLRLENLWYDIEFLS